MFYSSKLSKFFKTTEIEPDNTQTNFKVAKLKNKDFGNFHNNANTVSTTANSTQKNSLFE